MIIDFVDNRLSINIRVKQALHRSYVLFLARQIKSNARKLKGIVEEKLKNYVCIDVKFDFMIT